MPSSHSFDRREVVAFVVGLLVVGTAGFVVFSLDTTSIPVHYGPVVVFEASYTATNDTLEITHLNGDDICANTTYVVVRDESTQEVTTRTWVTTDPEYDAGNRRCREVGVSDSFVLAGANLEPGDRITVIWRTNRESIPKEQRREVLVRYEIELKTQSENSSVTTVVPT